MSMDYFIVGGYLKIQKNVFIQELLSRESLLRVLLNWKNTRDFSVKHPLIGETTDDSIVSINFSSEAAVCLSESPKDLLEGLKAKYKEKIKGRISCNAEYSLFGGIYTFDVDLSSDEGEIDYVPK